MSSELSADDPYRSPVQPEPAYAAPSGKQKPGWLTALCVLCIVIGTLGLMNGLIGLGATLFGEQLQQVLGSMSKGQQTQPELQKLQQKLQDETRAINEQFFVPTLIAVLLKVSISAVLIFGGIRALSLKRNSRSLLMWGCIVALLFELGLSVLQSVMYMETLAVYNQLLDNFLQDLQRDRNVVPAQAMMTIMQVALYAGIVVFFILQFIKVVFYFWGANYLRRPAIAALFVK